MKIGVILAAYNCEEYIDECLEPWLQFRDNSSHEIIIAATSGRFSQYKDLGIPENNSGTLKKLTSKGLDFLVTTSGDNLLEEDRSRDTCLNYLKPHKCDLIWLLDGDELYTKGEINGMIDYIERNPESEGFSIWMKNYTIKYPYFIPPWTRPTIYRNRLYGGIGTFHFDSFFDFEDGIHSIKDIKLNQIPKNVAFIEHYSWTDRGATRDKIKYQNNRHNWYEEGSRCSYECDDEGIFFSNTFHEKRKVEIPSLHSYPTDTLMSNIHISYNRNINRINVSSDYPISGYKLIVKDITTGKNYNKFDLNLIGESQFWCVPSGKSNEGYRIEIEKDNHITHIEEIHTNIGIR
tara:strand:+ start:335 stop:1378 length:1044 start_codon:yes stop_codon:yes gene_type:complete